MSAPLFRPQKDPFHQSDFFVDKKLISCIIDPTASTRLSLSGGGWWMEKDL
jgi:hypothetical protein